MEQNLEGFKNFTSCIVLWYFISGSGTLVNGFALCRLEASIYTNDAQIYFRKRMMMMMMKMMTNMIMMINDDNDKRYSVKYHMPYKAKKNCTPIADQWICVLLCNTLFELCYIIETGISLWINYSNYWKYLNTII